VELVAQDSAGEATEPAEAPGAEEAQQREAPSNARRPRNGKPTVPAWEDVLLGVRSNR
jgi:hypothetical protein